ncbi:ubiquitin family protein [Nocardia sp. NBC_01499]|uniref:ubiquitin-like domain-containing protein n=1 Tax=Nocardia sp. NBC_01499 TaxID=2903597 RepID=UPI00386E7BF3
MQDVKGPDMICRALLVLSIAGIIITPAVAQATPALSGTFLDSPARQAVQTITVNVVGQSATISVAIAPSATVAQLKAAIVKQTAQTKPGFLPDSANLYFDDTKNQNLVLLQNTQTLASYGMFDGCQVIVM